METKDVLIELFTAQGDSQYGGEAVTQLEHALQCATLAEQQQASPELIVAALLHDVGHLLHDLPDDAPDAGVDDHHEHAAANFLRLRFSAAVTEPVRLHVEAKRYLCATDAEYHGLLSQPSIQSLRLQGGPMTDDEVAEFARGDFAEAAVTLRRWDDEAKVVDLATPPLEHFLEYVERVALA